MTDGLSAGSLRTQNQVNDSADALTSWGRTFQGLPEEWMPDAVLWRQELKYQQVCREEG